MKSISIRPRIQRAFLSWLKANRDRFVIPLRLGRRTDRCLDIHFVGIASQISAYLSRSELGIAVEWQGQCWDLLACFESVPVRHGDSYVCELCIDKGHVSFPSREAIWRDHLFEPFLEWVNQRLAQAHWLDLHDWGGSTCAQLAVDRAESAKELVSIPLRQSSGVSVD